MATAQQQQQSLSGLSMTDILRRFWVIDNKKFCLWWLTKLTDEQRTSIIKTAGPDLPSSPRKRGEPLRPTDMLLPELIVEGLCRNKGKALVLFFTKRMMEDHVKNDLKYLNQLRKAKVLPMFAPKGSPIESLNFPVVDPKDPQNMRDLPAGATQEQKDAVMKRIEEHTLAHGDVWLAHRVRNEAIEKFLRSIVLQYRKAHPALASQSKQ